MRKLEKQDVYCASLVMKNPDAPKLSDWIDEIEYNVKKFPKDEIILIGHSLGVPSNTQIFTTNTTKNIKAGILISGPYKDDRKGKVAKVLKSFFTEKYKWDQIKKFGKNFTIIHGSNDPMVHFSQAKFLSEKLEGELLQIKNGGHLNGSSGFYTLPQALNAVCKIIKQR